MNKEITAQVVMLPTNSNNSHIGILKRNIDIINPLIYNSVGIFNTFAWSSQHLHFTTDEPIQKGDWYIHPFEDKVEKTQWVHIVALMNEAPKAQKIIASTDLSLGLPAIPTAWIRDVYVPSNGTIMSVQIEMEEHPMNKATFAQNMYQLKLTTNNEVVIVDEPVAFKLTKETAKMAQNAADPDGSIRAKITNILYPKVDQELEDAAKKSASGSPYGQFHFKAGANWQKQQSATDAIRFSRWISDNGYFAYTDNKWVHVPAGSKYSDQEVRNMITDKELYEIWQQSK